MNINPAYSHSLGDDGIQVLPNDDSRQAWQILQAKTVSSAKATLNSNMASKMKPTDVSYAKKLIAKAASAQLSSTEISWLQNFVSWYDAYNPKFWEWWESIGQSQTAAEQTAQSSPVKRIATATKNTVKSAVSTVVGSSDNNATKKSEGLPAPPMSLSGIAVTTLIATGVGVLAYVGYKKFFGRSRNSGKAKRR